jgi:hypothetical protein
MFRPYNQQSNNDQATTRPTPRIQEHKRPLRRLHLTEDGPGWHFQESELRSIHPTDRAEAINRLRATFRSLFGEAPPF